jgi:hypothetical protein
LVQLQQPAEEVAQRIDDLQPKGIGYQRDGEGNCVWKSTSKDFDYAFPCHPQIFQGAYSFYSVLKGMVE